MTEKVYSAEFQKVDVEKDSFCLDIINKAKELGFFYIFEQVSYKGIEYDSTKLSTDFNLALRAGQAGLMKEACKYAESHKKFDKDWPGLIKTDLFTELAARLGLRGMYKRRDASPEEQADYEKFAEFFSELKSKYFTSYVQEQWKTRPSKLWKPVAAAAAGLVALVAGAYGSYEYYIKPDIKNEIQQSMPVMPDVDKVLDSMIAKLRPELRAELEIYRKDIEKKIESYNDQSEKSIKRAIDEVMKERGLDNLLKMLEGK